MVFHAVAAAVAIVALTIILHAVAAAVEGEEGAGLQQGGGIRGLGLGGWGCIFRGLGLCC